MLTIWKFPYPLAASTVLEMPIGAKILTVQMQSGEACLWALVEPREAKKEERQFRLFDTGHPVPHDILDRGAYIGTFQREAFVFHMFEYPKAK